MKFISYCILKLEHFILYCKRNGIPLIAHFIGPVIRSVLTWWWPTCGRNM